MSSSTANTTGKRVLVVLEAGDRWASGVVRGTAYRDLFREHGFSAFYEVRQPHSAQERIANLPSLFRSVLSKSGVDRRLTQLATKTNHERILRTAREVDVVYLQKVTSFPLVKQLCRETKARVVYDFVDAVWLDRNSNNEFDEVLKIVDAVTTDNELIADYVRPLNSNCHVVPDAPALDEFDRQRPSLGKKPNDRIVLGWVGSSATVFNLYVIWEALEELFPRYPNLHLRLVGTGGDRRRYPKFERVSYSSVPTYDQSEMIKEIFGMHIGLFPLQNVERCRMRGVLKATNYMSGEAAVVTSPVGQCLDVIEDGVNGLIASSTQEWIDKLTLLINDAELRQKLTKNGLETVRSKFRRDQSFAKLKRVLEDEEASVRSS